MLQSVPPAMDTPHDHEKASACPATPGSVAEVAMPYLPHKSTSDGFVGSVRHGRGCSHIKYYICLTDKNVSALESADEEEVQESTTHPCVGWVAGQGSAGENL